MRSCCCATLPTVPKYTIPYTCCPTAPPPIIVMCPNGKPAIQRCSTYQPCPGQGTSYGCFNGGCCPIKPPILVPTVFCPNGLQAVQTCTTNLQCPSVNYKCANGGCCLFPHPIPIGISANSVVQAAPSTCPNGESPLLTCTTITDCPSGYDCVKGGCCSIAKPK